MTRLRMRERQTLDTLVGAGVARSRSDALAWCVRLVREHKKFVEAQLETVQTRSPHRVEPRCPYFGRCGGCAYQHIDYEHQLALKSRQVEQTLLRIGGIANAPVRPIIASPLEYSYRNRITVHARDGI